MKALYTLIFSLFSLGIVWGGQFEYKKADTTILFQSLCAADSGKINCMDFVQRIPRDLKFQRASARPNGITYFGIDLVPMTDSAGQLKGPLCSNYNILLALYTNYAISYLTIYGYKKGELVEFWQSDMLNGRGDIKVGDLKASPWKIIILDLLFGPHEYQNTYFLSWDKDGMHVLNPSGKMGLLSEFMGYVNYVSTDSGLNISSYHPTGGVVRTYILRKGAQRIMLVSEKKVMNKE